jgi:hypothetical protein
MFTTEIMSKSANKTAKPRRPPVKVTYTTHQTPTVYPISGALIMAAPNTIQLKCYIESPKIPKESQITFNDSEIASENLHNDGLERSFLTTLVLDTNAAYQLATTILKNIQAVSPQFQQTTNKPQDNNAELHEHEP